MLMKSGLSLRQQGRFTALFPELCDFSPAWGILTGVRPAKLFCSFAEDVGTDEACSIFKNEYLVDGKKIELCKASADAEKKAKSKSFGNSFSLYVSIPFCPSRCHYCSFVSHSVANAGKLVPKYVELLTEEIKKTAEVAKKIGLRLSTVYFGGGRRRNCLRLSLRRFCLKSSKALTFLRSPNIRWKRADPTP